MDLTLIKIQQKALQDDEEDTFMCNNIHINIYDKTDMLVIIFMRNNSRTKIDMYKYRSCQVNFL